MRKCKIQRLCSVLSMPLRFMAPNRVNFSGQMPLAASSLTMTPHRYGCSSTNQCGIFSLACIFHSHLHISRKSMADCSFLVQKRTNNAPPPPPISPGGIAEPATQHGDISSLKPTPMEYAAQQYNERSATYTPQTADISFNLVIFAPPNGSNRF